MAESAWTANVLCRYYVQGACRKGDSCHFSHDLSDRPATVCKYYQQGCCNYGERCRYDHVKPSHSSCKAASRSSKPVSSSDITPHMVTLKKLGVSADSGIGDSDQSPVTVRDPDEWVKAAEFVPRNPIAPPSFSEVLGGDKPKGKELSVQEQDAIQLCPYAAHGECWYGENCVYTHGFICDMCDRAVLHPLDAEQCQKHKEECLKQHEEDMERSFAIAASRDKVCGVCMEVVMDKKPLTERRFGILSNCNHIFCLSCIRKWRGNKQFENKLVRSCPECRIPSDFVTPSKYWIQDQEDKKKLIEGYKQALRCKPCKYFDEGRGDCPFNENCFYKHAYPDGKPASPKPKRRRARTNADGELDLIQRLILWDFLEERSNSHFTLEFEWDDDSEELILSGGLFAFSDDSDFSD